MKNSCSCLKTKHLWDHFDCPLVEIINMMVLAKTISHLLLRISPCVGIRVTSCMGTYLGTCAMRMRIRNASPHANVLNLKKRAYRKGKYILSLNAINKSRPVKAIRKSEGSKSSRSPWFEGDEDDDDDGDSVSSVDSKVDDEEVDLPTVDRPYSKLISFQNYHEESEAQEVEGTTNQSNRNKQKFRIEKNNNQTSSSDAQETNSNLTPLQFYSSTSGNITPGNGSKNLAFLRQQLVDQQSKERGGKLVTWSEVDNPYSHLKGFSTMDLEFSPQETKDLPDKHDFQNIEDFIPIPKTIDDFDMSVFHDFPDQLHANEWDLVKNDIRKDQLDSKFRHVVQFHRGLEDKEERELHNNLFPQNRLYVIDSVDEHHMGSLLFSDEAIRNFKSGLAHNCTL